jgi:hypothetical protein
METKAISIAKLTPLGIAVILATSIFSLSINANHAKGWGIVTAAGNMTNSTQPLQPLSQPQIPNSVPSNALDAIFQKCFMSHMNPIVRNTLNPMDIAVIEKDAIQNMTAPVPHIPNNPALDQLIHNTYVGTVKPIADCMRQEQQQPYQQQQAYQQQQPYSFPSYQQQPNNNYPLPRILSQSAYTSSTGTVHIVGEVINQSPVTAKFVKVIVTFYNAYNQVIGTDNTYTEPTDLAQGQRAPFELIELSGSIPMNQVRNYVLSVTSS